MKKLIVLFILCLALYAANGQSDLMFQLDRINDCGEWVEESPIITDWVTIEIISENDIVDKDCEWYYSEWEVDMRNEMTLQYCPCGCGGERVRTQKRINDNGVIQQRKEIIPLKYIPKPKTKYELKLEELKNNIR